MDVLSLIFEMCNSNKPFIPKRSWSKLLWERAWKIEDMYWYSTRMLHKDNDLLAKTMPYTRHLNWWDMSDRFPNRIKECEVMAKLISHASKLKSDDVRLKCLTTSYTTCIQCDMFQREDLFHVIMQCPKQDTLRREMYDTLNRCNENFRPLIDEHPHDVFNWLIGKEIPSLDIYAMYSFSQNYKHVY